MKRLFDCLRAVPHLFGKVMVIWCVASGTTCSFWAVRVLSRTGQDASGLLVPILGFFGGELALMFGKNALQNKKEAGRTGGKEEKTDGSDRCA